MNKKVLLLLASLMFITLTACGLNTTKENKSAEITEQNFLKLITSYTNKQQALMVKQGEGESGEFDKISQHAKTVVDSKEYREWIEASKKMEDADVTKLDSSEIFSDLQAALKEYNQIQIKYFQELAKAPDMNSYNDINEQLANQLEDAQNNFIELMGKML